MHRAFWQPWVAGVDWKLSFFRCREVYGLHQAAWHRWDRASHSWYSRRLMYGTGLDKNCKMFYLVFSSRHWRAIWQKSCIRSSVKPLDELTNDNAVIALQTSIIYNVWKYVTYKLSGCELPLPLIIMCNGYDNNCVCIYTFLFRRTSGQSKLPEHIQVHCSLALQDV